MDIRKRYFISIDTQEIRTTSVPDGIEFEIIATEADIEEFEELFAQKDKHEKKAVKYLAKPFNEFGVDDEREIYDSYLMEVYRRVYELGTEETKIKIEELGLFD